MAGENLPLPLPLNLPLLARSTNLVPARISATRRPDKDGGAINQRKIKRKSL
jgi:hypothetical protein